MYYRRMESPHILEEFKLYVKHISTRAAIDLCFIPRILNKLHLGRKWEWAAKRRFFTRHFSDIFSRYDFIKRNIKPLTENCDIFTLWYQGWGIDLPPVIAECHRSLIRNANGHRVILLDKDNIKDYCDFPNVIWERLEGGQISFTHFKDLLSCYILNRYGGLWIDAGVYVTGPIEVVGSSFYSVRYHNRTGCYCNFKYCIALLGMPRGSIIAALLTDLLIAYWTKFSMELHYLFFVDIMDEIYERFPSVRQLLESNNLYCDDFYEFRYLAGRICDDEEKLKRIIADNKFLSLTYRFPIPLSIDGKPTYYNKLLQYHNR